MTGFVARRVAQTVPLLLLVTLFSFLLIHLAPGDPAEMILRSRLTYPPTDEQILNMRRELGLDEDLVTQYVRWLQNVAIGNFGESIWTGERVGASLKRTFPVTLQLSFVAFLVAASAGVLLGILAAVRQGGMTDNLSRVIALAGASLPNFWLGYLLILAFAVFMGLLPSQGVETPSSYILPAIAVAFGPLGALIRLTRTGMLDVLGQDFLVAAKARGLRPNYVLFRHALPVAINPVLSYAGLVVGTLLSGAVVVETVFAMPGVGKLLVDAITHRDYPVVQGFVLCFGIIVVVINAIVDVLYGLIDPRIRVD